jgi:hypothetical protein
MKENDSFAENLKRAIAHLMKGHVGTCLVLSSYKVAAVLKENFGTDVNISKVGRFISRFAKVNNLERLGTNVPKFKIERANFDKITFDMPKTKLGPAV